MRNRKSIRKQDHDYSSEGYYFITINTQDRINLFGEIVNGQIIGNKNYDVCIDLWRQLPNYYPNITLDEFIIMPNHLHGIIVISETNTEIDNVGKINHTGATNSARAIHSVVGAIHELPLRNELTHRDELTHRHELTHRDELPIRNALKHHHDLHDRQASSEKPNETEIYRKQRRIMLIPKIIGRFKMQSAKQINDIQNTRGTKIWQRNYYDRIIRSEKEYINIRNYIINNPLNWENDIKNK